MNSLRTLILDTSMRPHRISDWKSSITQLCCTRCGDFECVKHKDGTKLEVLENYEAAASSPSVTIYIPAVARLKREVAHNKKGIKFSRQNIFSRDKNKCCYCDEVFAFRELTYDHVLPRSKGGKTTWENIVAACKVCNRHKGQRTPAQAGMKMHFQPHKPKTLPLTQPFLVAVDSIPELWKPYIEAFSKSYAVGYTK